MRRGTPPNASKAAACPSRKHSCLAAGKAQTKGFSEYARRMQKRRATRSIPAIRTSASPQSHCASAPGE